MKMPESGLAGNSPDYFECKNLVYVNVNQTYTHRTPTVHPVVHPAANHNLPKRLLRPANQASHIAGHLEKIAP